MKKPTKSVQPQKQLPKEKKVFDPSIYATKTFPAEDVMKLKQCFDVFDYDKSESISAEQLVIAIRALGLQHEAGKILKIVNAHSTSEEMDFETFLTIFGFSGDNTSEASLKQLFEIFDKNGTGYFGVQQFAQVCDSVGERFSETELAQMIDYADKDRDGKINFQEFVDIVTKQYPKI